MPTTRSFRCSNCTRRFADELVARGLPLWRSSLGLELLHPEQSGVRSLWTLNEGATKTLAPRGVENLPDYLNSPVRIVDETEQPFRQRLAGADAESAAPR